MGLLPPPSSSMGLGLLLLLSVSVATVPPRARTTTADDQHGDQALANTSTTTFVATQAQDFGVLSGGASVTAAPLNALRSGNPGEHTTAAFRTPLAPGITVQHVQFAYRYNTGFGPTGVGTNFTVSVAGVSVYESPHLTDYTYSHNRSNFSEPVTVDVDVSIAVPPKPAPNAAPAMITFSFDNNARNVQLLLPLVVSLQCSGGSCAPPPPPPQSHSLVFGEPSIVAGPECPTSQGGGPWWDKIHAVSDTHALGWAETHLIATIDGGKTWNTLNMSDGCVECDDSTSNSVYDHGSPPSFNGAVSSSFHTLGNLNVTHGTKGNITGLSSLASTRYYLDKTTGNFARNITGPVTISGLPNMRSFSPGSGGYITLRDGSMIGIAKSVLGTGIGRLSASVYRSVDGGFNWKYVSVISTAEVPYALEGPSEASLAVLKNGTLMAVMRVDGQSGHYQPYLGALSDDGGLSWHSLAPLHGGGSGGVNGAGCVRPRLLTLGNNSLVLSGGRPNPLSRDVLVWLNSNGDGEDWEAYSISYWHNLHNTNPNWTFPASATNSSRSFPRLTTSYTSLVGTGNNSGYVVYGMGVRSFALPFTLIKNN